MAMKSLSIAATGMQAQQLNVDVISNNIANLSTTAFKRQRAEFQDLIYQSYTRVGSQSSNADTIVPTGIEIGAGVKPGAVYSIMEQGNVVQTGNDLDIAIQGNGYLEVELPNGDQAYTRAGTLSRNGEGEIVTAEGYLVQPGLVIPQEAIAITINPNGEVLATLSDQVEDEVVGQFDLVNFQNPAGLARLGDNLLKETEASGAPIVGVGGDPGFGTILQRFVETSNVDVVTELTTLITAQRSFELNSRVISTTDEMLQTVSQLS